MMQAEVLAVVGIVALMGGLIFGVVWMEKLFNPKLINEKDRYNELWDKHQANLNALEASQAENKALREATSSASLSDQAEALKALRIQYARSKQALQVQQADYDALKLRGQLEAQAAEAKLQSVEELMRAQEARAEALERQLKAQDIEHSRSLRDELLRAYTTSRAEALESYRAERDRLTTRCQELRKEFSDELANFTQAKQEQNAGDDEAKRSLAMLENKMFTLKSMVQISEQRLEWLDEMLTVLEAQGSTRS